MATREDHCTNPNQRWCDCDWCRIHNHWGPTAADAQYQRKTAGGRAMNPTVNGIPSQPSGNHDMECIACGLVGSDALLDAHDCQGIVEEEDEP
jgi:hypothetical protein